MDQRKDRIIVGLISLITVLVLLGGIGIGLIISGTNKNDNLKRYVTETERDEDIKKAVSELLAEYEKKEPTEAIDKDTNEGTEKVITIKQYITQELKKGDGYQLPNGNNVSMDKDDNIYHNKDKTDDYIDDSGNVKKRLNVIFMIGDGMGQNHIKAGEIYKGEKLNMQTIPNSTDVTTYSLSGTTDSAASATALSSGIKTWNSYIGKDGNGNDVETLVEYSKKLGLKAGTVSTQTIYHATPAGFTAHTSNREDYSLIARRLFGTEEYFANKGISYKSTTDVLVDLMIGGGSHYFNYYRPWGGWEEADPDFIEAVRSKGYTYVTDFSQIASIDKDKHVIGTFSDDRMTKDEYGNAKNADPSLVEMTELALSRLENDKGFFVMIEGSDIDTFSHKGQIGNMLNEMICFDNVVKVAMNYVDKNPNTLLVITADHETGGLILDGVTSPDQLVDSLYTSGGGGYYPHTNSNVLVYAYGKDAAELTNHGTIDNTDISKFIRSKLKATYES